MEGKGSVDGERVCVPKLPVSEKWGRGWSYERESEAGKYGEEGKCGDPSKKEKIYAD